MRILLICAAGMSTSLVVDKMKQAVQPGEDTYIKAEPVENFEDVFRSYDVILLGPQMKFKKREFQHMTQGFGIPVDVINMVDYGTVRGDKILQYAKQLYNSKFESIQ